MKRKIIIGLLLSAFVLASSLAQAQGARKNSDKGERGYSRPGQNHKGDRGFQRNHHHNDRNVYASNHGNYRISFNYGDTYACRPRPSMTRLIYERGRFFKRSRHGMIEVNPPIGYRVDHIPMNRSSVHFHGKRKHYVFRGVVFQRIGRQFEVVGIESC